MEDVAEIRGAGGISGRKKEDENHNVPTAEVQDATEVFHKDLKVEPEEVPRVVLLTKGVIVNISIICVGRLDSVKDLVLTS